YRQRVQSQHIPAVPKDIVWHTLYCDGEQKLTGPTFSPSQPRGLVVATRDMAERAYPPSRHGALALRGDPRSITVFCHISCRFGHLCCQQGLISRFSSTAKTPICCSDRL